VRITGPEGPEEVMTMVCSQWAARLQSVVRIVQPSRPTRYRSVPLDEHRLDRDDQSLAQLHTPPGSARVRHARLLVHGGTDAVAAEPLGYTVAGAPSDRLDGVSHVTDAGARYRRRNACVPVDGAQSWKPYRGLVDGTGADRDRSVRVVPVDDDGRVDGEQVAFGERAPGRGCRARWRR
jgi:hypothetical protein